MLDEQVEYSANVPADLPSRDTIAHLCSIAGYNRNGVSIEIAGKPLYWVKYGVCIAVGEGRTQAQVAGIVNADPVSIVHVPEVYLIFSRAPLRYIVMQYVEGSTVGNRMSGAGKYEKDDLKAVAAAVKRLTDIRMPADTPPGYFGGGTIGHVFFVEAMSTLVYPTVGHLQRQINRVCFPLALSTSQ